MCRLSVKWEGAFSGSVDSVLLAVVFKASSLPIRCRLAGAQEGYSRRCGDRLDGPNQAIPRHGCIPAEPPAVSPYKIIVPRIVIGGVILDQPACFQTEFGGCSFDNLSHDLMTGNQTCLQRLQL